MQVIRLSSARLKITISSTEAEQFLDGGEAFSCHDPKTKYMLCSLLRRAVERTDFLRGAARLLVELYPKASGGYTIYFTKSSELKPYFSAHQSFCVATFKRLDDLLSFGRAAANRGFCLGGSLYRFYEDYCLIIQKGPKSKLLCPLITEFADRFVCSDKRAATVSEYGFCLIKENAIEELLKRL